MSADHIVRFFVGIACIMLFAVVAAAINALCMASIHSLIAIGFVIGSLVFSYFVGYAVEALYTRHMDKKAKLRQVKQIIDNAK